MLRSYGVAYLQYIPDSTHVYIGYLCMLSIDSLHQAYRFGELFAGAANVTSAMQLRGFPAFKMDRKYSQVFDFLTPAGYANLGFVSELLNLNC